MNICDYEEVCYDIVEYVVDALKDAPNPDISKPTCYLNVLVRDVSPEMIVES